MTRLRPLYEKVPPFPGSIKVKERVDEEEEFDGQPTGSFAVTITYRLPDSVKAAEVIGHLRTHLPKTWHEVTDDTCRKTMATLPAPPTAALPDGTPATPTTPINPRSFVLLRKATQLTVFLPGETGAADGHIDGVTFELARNGPIRLLLVHTPTYGCAAADDRLGSEIFDSP